jgi:hypothetical protein
MHQSAVYIAKRNQNLCSMLASFSIIRLFAIIESHCMEACDWAFASKQVDKYLQPVHIVNELVTPEVDYDSWREFVDLVYLVQDVFCNLLAEAVQQEFQTEHLSPVLGSIYCRIPTLAHLKATGPSVMMQLTKSNGEFWCSMVSHFVCARALRAATIFEDVSTSLGDMLSLEDARVSELQEQDRVALMISVMQQEVRHTFSGAMPFSIYTLCSGFVSTLLVKNFTFYDDKQLTAFTHEQFRHILLALCMGLHPRLGKLSSLLPVTSDILRLVCARLCATQLEKHIVFHTQEQWLY